MLSSKSPVLTLPPNVIVLLLLVIFIPISSNVSSFVFVLETLPNNNSFADSDDVGFIVISFKNCLRLSFFYLTKSLNKRINRLI